MSSLFYLDKLINLLVRGFQTLENQALLGINMKLSKHMVRHFATPSSWGFFIPETINLLDIEQS